MKEGLTAHMIVCNEEQWVWYAIASVIDHVERIFVYDTGSQDQTVQLIKNFGSRKIHLEKKGRVLPAELVSLRNEQVKKTHTAWFMLLDGDEVWSDKTIRELAHIANSTNSRVMGVVVPALVPVGDLFHYQPESAGKYHLLGQVGHMNLRGYRKLTGYKWQGIYPLEAYADKRSIPIQENLANLVMLRNPYWHLTHLQRSSIDTHKKLKLEIGEKRKNIKLPEVFFASRPKIVPSPWVSFSPTEKLVAQTVTPLLKIKRKIL